MKRAVALLTALGFVAVATLMGQNRDAGAFAPGVLRIPHKGVAAPIAKKVVNPKYTPAAEEAKIEGSITLECVVDIEGKVDAVRVAKSIDTVHGLDGQAVKALKAWSFTPATRDAMPIASVVQVEFTFKLTK